MQDQNGEFFVKGDTVAWTSDPKRTAIVKSVLQPSVDRSGYVLVTYPGTISETGNSIIEYVGAGIGLMVVRGES